MMDASAAVSVILGSSPLGLLLTVLRTAALFSSHWAPHQRERDPDRHSEWLGPAH